MEELVVPGTGKISYTDIGEGEVVVWIHGFCEDHTIWDRMVRHFSNRYRCITVDCIGFGRSQPDEAFDFSMESQARAVAFLLSYISVSRATFIGHSMGGYIALSLLAEKPELFSGITLFHSTAAPDTDERKINRNKTIELIRRAPEIFIREFYYNLFAPHRKNEFTAEIELFKEKAACIQPATIISTLKGLRDRNDYREKLKSAECRKLFIAGAHDLLLPAGQLAEQAGDTGAQIYLLENSGHMGFLEEAEESINAVMQVIM